MKIQNKPSWKWYNWRQLVNQSKNNESSHKARTKEEEEEEEEK